MWCKNVVMLEPGAFIRDFAIFQSVFEPSALFRGRRMASALTTGRDVKESLQMSFLNRFEHLLATSFRHTALRRLSRRRETRQETTPRRQRSNGQRSTPPSIQFP